MCGVAANRHCRFNDSERLWFFLAVLALATDVPP